MERFSYNKFYENMRKSLHIGRKVMRFGASQRTILWEIWLLYVIVYVHFSW